MIGILKYVTDRTREKSAHFARGEILPKHLNFSLRLTINTRQDLGKGGFAATIWPEQSQHFPTIQREINSFQGQRSIPIMIIHLLRLNNWLLHYYLGFLFLFEYTPCKSGSERRHTFF